MKIILNDMESIEELENKYQGEQLRFDPTEKAKGKFEITRIQYTRKRIICNCY